MQVIARAGAGAGADAAARYSGSDSRNCSARIIRSDNCRRAFFHLASPPHRALPYLLLLPLALPPFLATTQPPPAIPRSSRFRARVLCATAAQLSRFCAPGENYVAGVARGDSGMRCRSRFRALALAVAKAKNASRFCDARAVARADARRPIGGFNSDRMQTLLLEIKRDDNLHFVRPVVVSTNS